MIPVTGCSKVLTGSNHWMQLYIETQYTTEKTNGPVIQFHMFSILQWLTGRGV
jgi:hypothetical protein